MPVDITGYNLRVPFATLPLNPTAYTASPRRKDDFRAGISKEAYAWLVSAIGPRCRNIADWESHPEYQWYYHGALWDKTIQSYVSNMWFRTKDQAMLYKLTWMI